MGCQNGKEADVVTVKTTQKEVNGNTKESSVADSKPVEVKEEPKVSEPKP